MWMNFNCVFRSALHYISDVRSYCLPFNGAKSKHRTQTFSFRKLLFAHWIIYLYPFSPRFCAFCWKHADLHNREAKDAPLLISLITNCISHSLLSRHHITVSAVVEVRDQQGEVQINMAEDDTVTCNFRELCLWNDIFILKIVSVGIQTWWLISA